MNDVDLDDEVSKGRALITSEFLGSAGEDENDDDVVDDTEGDVNVRRRALFDLTLDECKALLSRDRECERARAPGRHKQADTQMRDYVQVFGSVLRLGLPEVRHQERFARSDDSHLATSLPLAAAATFQRAVAKEMRMQQQGAGALEENVAESSIQDIQGLQRLNRAKDEEACLSVPLADALKGPGHVAWESI